MNNLKKLGLTALAGSLALTTANATEYSVTGDAVLKTKKHLSGLLPFNKSKKDSIFIISFCTSKTKDLLKRKRFWKEKLNTY